jgi:hypothetical protein
MAVRSGTQIRRMRKAILFAWVSLCLTGATLALMPSSWLPLSWKGFVSAKGVFHGETVKITVPKHLRFPAKAEVTIAMEKGACAVCLQSPEGEKHLFSVGKGRIPFHVSGEGYCRLDPGGNPGKYNIFIGSKWHPFGPSGRLVLLLFCLGSLVPPLLKGRLALVVTAIGPRRLLFLIVVWTLACFFYSVAHEFGHYSVGVLLGGTVKEVKWTILSGQEPHVSFQSLPPEAGPWMSAGGTLFPVALAIIFLTAWMVFAKRMPWYLSATTASIGLAWLITTLGAIFDVINYDTLPYNHMGALARHLGLRGWSMILFVLSPLVLALVMYGLFGYRLCGIIKSCRSGTSDSSDVPK